MTVPGADPAQLRIEQDLAAGDFEAGVSAGHWRLIQLDWPRLTAAVTYGDGGELGLLIAVDGYPRLAPAGQPWDLRHDRELPCALWPEGGPSQQVFRRDWSPANANAPYLACDRTGLATHPNWAAEHPDRTWHPGRTIAFYLTEIHRGLRGATLPAAETAP
jgi:hypothetical protein